LTSLRQTSSRLSKACARRVNTLLRPTIPIAKPVPGREELEAVRKVFESGILIQEEKVKLLEQKFAEYIGVEQAVAVANGTMALDAALKALKIDPGDEVITSAFSFVASSNCVLYQVAKPVFADIDLRSFNIDASDVAEDHEIALVEDAAQADGSEYK